MGDTPENVRCWRVVQHKIINNKEERDKNTACVYMKEIIANKKDRYGITP